MQELRIVIGVAEEVPPEDDPLLEPEEALLYQASVMSFNGLRVVQMLSCLLACSHVC